MINRLLILLLFFTPVCSVFSQAVGDFQSANSGVWTTAANWQTWNGAAWVAAGASPTSASPVVTILSGHTMQINATITIDQVIINSGGTINWTLGTLTIGAGAGVDLQILGTFWDNRGGATSIVFAAGATWSFGANGTLIKSAGNGSNVWQGAYNTGIANIPATSNWILRKTTAQNPQITTVGGFYGNLTIENNNAGIWTTAAGATFNGAGGFPTIKGNLDIGGSGTSTVDFLNDCQNATPTTVGGNFTLRAGNIIRNNGTGFRIAGNITVSGTISYDSDHNRIIELNGTGAQTIDATGTFGIYNFTLNKTTGTATLNNSITVNNVATFTSGILTSTLTNLLIIAANGSVSGVSNASFTNGPVRYLGSSAFTFPVGKTASYRQISIGAGGVAGGPFWTETFNNGCAANCTANGVNTGNGAWTIDNSNNPAFDNCFLSTQPNVWYVSCADNGNASGSCGTGCGTNATLHIGSTTVGDLGASFDAGGYCDILGGIFGGGTNTNTMVVSPTISTLGKTNITLSFDYLHFGDLGLDWAWIDYSINNGASWNTLANPLPQVTCCGGACNNTNQGRWATFSTVLPVAAENIAGFKIRFGWINNDDATGYDPSIGINDIVLSTPSATTSFTAEYFPANPQIPYGNLLAPTLATISDCEYWILSRDAGSDSRTVTLSWDAASCDITSLPDLRVARYDGISTWQDHGNGGTTGNATAGTIISSAAVSTFSPFTIANITNLPIQLLFFNAIAENNKTKLSWETASEINNDYFTIERSVDGLHFYPIAEMDGAGNSDYTIQYHTYDLQPVIGVNFYRLKQTDFNGAFSYSNIQSVYFSDENELNLVNAFENGDWISFFCTSKNEGKVNLEITDMSGRVVYSTITICGSRIDIPKNNISAGIYLIRINDGIVSDQQKLFVR